MEEISYTPIGEVESPFDRPEEVPIDPTASTGATGRIRLDPAYREGLAHLEGFSHVVIVAHLHLLAEETTLRTAPPFAPDVEPGVFATRSPVRPNNVALSIVRLAGVDGATLEVEGIDLVDGTPVIDLKPFAPKDHELAGLEMGWLEDVEG